MEERRKSYIEGDFSNKDIQILWLKLQKEIAELEKKMLTKENIKGIVNERIEDHKTNCELCTGNYLTIENCFNEWLKCKKRHDDESIATLNKWWELGRKAVAVGLLLAGGGGLVKLAEVLK